MMSGGALLALTAFSFGELGDFHANTVSVNALLGLFYLAIPNALTFGTPVLAAGGGISGDGILIRLHRPDSGGSPGMDHPRRANCWPMISGATLVVISVFVLVTPPRWALERLSAFSPEPVLRRIRCKDAVRGPDRRLLRVTSRGWSLAPPPDPVYC